MEWQGLQVDRELSAKQEERSGQLPALLDGGLSRGQRARQRGAGLEILACRRKVAGNGGQKVLEIVGQA